MGGAVAIGKNETMAWLARHCDGVGCGGAVYAPAPCRVFINGGGLARGVGLRVSGGEGSWRWSGHGRCRGCTLCSPAPPLSRSLPVVRVPDVQPVSRRSAHSARLRTLRVLPGACGPELFLCPVERRFYVLSSRRRMEARIALRPCSFKRASFFVRFEWPFLRPGLGSEGRRAQWRSTLAARPPPKAARNAALRAASSGPPPGKPGRFEATC